MNDENVRTDREFEERAKLLFDESVASLDGEICSKLTQARYRALEGLESPRQPAWASSLLPAGAVAVVAMLTVMLWQGQVDPTAESNFEVAAATDLEMLLGEEELDMIEELEFYAWLEEQVELTEGRIVEDGIG